MADARPVRTAPPPIDSRVETAFPMLTVHYDEAPVRWRSPDHPDEGEASIGHVCTDPKYGTVLVDSSPDPLAWRVFKIADAILLEDDNWPVGKPRPDAPKRECPACALDLAPAAKFCSECGTPAPAVKTES